MRPVEDHAAPADGNVALRFRDADEREIGRDAEGDRDGELIADAQVLAQGFGAGMLVFQMSRCSIQLPPILFHTTTYFPRSATEPSLALMT
jgi:hypothetical protein